MKSFLHGSLFMLPLVCLVSCRSTHPENMHPLDASLSSYRSFIAETVPDKDRSGALIAVGDDLHRVLTEDMRTLRNLATKLHRLNADYRTTREAMESALSDSHAQRVLMRDHILEARAKAVALTTPEEWPLLIRRDKNLVDMFDETPGVL